MIKSLRADSKRSFNVLSEEAGVPTTTFFDNYKRLIKQSVLIKPTVLLDFKRLGFFFRTLVLLKSDDSERLLEYLDAHPNVNSLFKINKYDFFADVIFPGVKQFYDFLEDVEKLDAEFDFHEVIDQLKNECFLV